MYRRTRTPAKAPKRAPVASLNSINNATQLFVFGLIEVLSKIKEKQAAYLRVSVKNHSSIHSNSTHAPHNNLAAGFTAT